MIVNKINILISIMFFRLISMGQTTQASTSTPIAQEIIGASPEELPEYPGGYTAMQNFIKTNVQYPKSMLEKGIDGTVFLRFTVDTIGNIKDIKILKGVKDCSECDEEAKRLFSIMPKWKPGKANGKLMPVYFNYPIKFKLQ